MNIEKNHIVKECGFMPGDVADTGPLEKPIIATINVYDSEENPNEMVNTHSFEVDQIIIANYGNGLRVLFQMDYVARMLLYDELIKDDVSCFKFIVSFMFNTFLGEAKFSCQTLGEPTFHNRTDVKGMRDEPMEHFYHLVFHTDIVSTKLTLNGKEEPKDNIFSLLKLAGKSNDNDDAIRQIVERLQAAMTSPKWFQEAEKLNENKPEDLIATEKAEEIKIKASKKKLNKELKKASPSGTDNEIFDVSSLTVRKGSSHPIEDLDRLIGLEDVKKAVKKIYSKQKFDSKFNMNTKSSVSSLHMCFYGNPGTGKTTVARIITGILFEMGLIKENRCVEINGLDLVGNYVGQTAIITKKIIDFAKGGILFVDEAYALNSMKNSYGAEAVSVLLKEMEDNRDDIVIILAGYPKPMDEFLNLNSGFRSRINRYFDFKDYSVSELLQIFGKELKERNYAASQTIIEKAAIDFMVESKQPKFSNGRFVRNYIENLEEDHIEKVMSNPKLYTFNHTDKNYIRKIK